MDTRPRYIAPILTPHYDEEQHWLAYREYRRLLKAGEDPDNATPVIGSSDDLIEVLYSLIGPEFDRLTPIDGGQDLILAIGEHETRIEVGEDNTLRFNNIEHLAGLDPEDFLSMRLYLNQDAGNVLWEYAFEHLVLGTQLAGYDPSTGETLYISADAPRVPLEAILIGYAGRENKEPVRVRWWSEFDQHSRYRYRYR